MVYTNVTYRKHYKKIVDLVHIFRSSFFAPLNYVILTGEKTTNETYIENPVLQFYSN